ncbi:MAG: neutral/alkaline non-lysosomal ceramidase N-terminal domain-containing protein [Opitutae bacterium]|nr:neutral/alkaline non-lysosomal ceramidase N-terminal domain-containing protein [Opitutae bacterium]
MKVRCGLLGAVGKIAALMLLALTVAASGAAQEAGWRCGVAKTRITPRELLWMGGFASRTRPAEGTLDDLWVKALALEAPDGGVGVLITTDLLGTPKWLYENLCARLQAKHGLGRAQLLIAASHTHSGPALRDTLPDVYPLDARQREQIAEYSRDVEEAIVATVDAALAQWRPARLFAGETRLPLAVNRRANRERDIARGAKPQGPSDHAVPVLAVRAPDDRVLAVVFGYAAHTSMLLSNVWSADYVGFARRKIEAEHAGAEAFFFEGCSSDQSAAPRGTLALCKAAGERMGAAVLAVMAQPMRPLAPKFQRAHTFIPLAFGQQPTKADLRRWGAPRSYEARWAERLEKELKDGKVWPTGYPEYPVEVWKLGGEQLWIALGGEVCVDYALMFKAKYGANTWIAGYSNDVMAYIPSRRIWEEGGYQAGAFDVYGLPALRWTPDIETLITGAVARLEAQVR